MTEIHLAEKKNIHDRLEERICELLTEPFEIKRTVNGKPYIEGDPLFFSISHSGEKAAFAISDMPVGIDLELFKGKAYPSALARFSKREREEIRCEEDFLRHWTAREAFIKMRGETLAKYFKRLEFFRGEIYLDGKKCECCTEFRRTDDGIIAICRQDNN